MKKAVIAIGATVLLLGNTGCIAADALNWASLAGNWGFGVSQFSTWAQGLLAHVTPV